ncbi:MAG: hypothetical protein ABJI96_02080 [Paracoccaceae bacterium]
MSTARSYPDVARPVHRSNDYHELPATEKQIGYARALAKRSGIVLPWNALGDRKSLSAWIEARQNDADRGGFSNYPSSKQVAFAERIARHKQRQVPQECFRDRAMMSRWIDSNR